MQSGPMAHRLSLSPHSAVSPCISTPASSASHSASAASAAPVAAATFSIFQEGPGMALVYSPPRGTPELEALVGRFIALDVPVAMKMAIIEHDFETHAMRTSQRYKVYTVQSVALVAAPVITAAPSLSELDLPVLSDTVHTQSSWMSTSTPLTVASIGSASASSASASASAVSAASSTSASASASASASEHPHRSMQILTRSGQDITHLSTRTMRTSQEKESTRIVRKNGACSSCRRKKVRCDPSHMGRTATASSSRAAPYAAPVFSGRAKEEMAAAKEAEAAQARRTSKQPVTTADPMILDSRMFLTAAPVDMFGLSESLLSESLGLDLFSDQALADDALFDLASSSVSPVAPAQPRVPQPQTALQQFQQPGESMHASLYLSGEVPESPDLLGGSPDLFAAAYGCVDSALRFSPVAGLDSQSSLTVSGESASQGPVDAGFAEDVIRGDGQPLQFQVLGLPVLGRAPLFRRRPRHYADGLGQASVRSAGVATNPGVTGAPEISANPETSGVYGLADLVYTYAGMAALASSLLPSLLVWAASQAAGKELAKRKRGVDCLAARSSLVACQ